MSIFTPDYAESIASLGEVELIRQIGHWLGAASPPPPAGIGDDCAVLEPNTAGKTIVTTDSVSYGQHFDDSVSAVDAGAKLIKRNLSDIAAMGGTPGQAVLALLCGRDISKIWLEAFFHGVRNTCLEYEVQLVGGDVSSLAAGNFSAVLTLSGTALNPILRHTAQIGDHIFVTGTLGGSIRGKHYNFKPRLQEGLWLAQQDTCSAMMDLTDGLGKDLQALLPPASSAAIDTSKVQISRAAVALASESAQPVIKHAFCDGEDYELLFTLSQTHSVESFIAKWQEAFPDLRLSCIGQITDQQQAVFVDAYTGDPLPWTHGFEHLKDT